MKGSVSVPGEKKQPGVESFQFLRYMLHWEKSRGGSGCIHGLIFTGLPWMAKGVIEYKTS